MELENEIHEKITELCTTGDKLAEKRQYNAAITEYEKALELIPSPKTDWHANVWVETAIGDAYFFLKEYNKAKASFQTAYNSDQSNPFILMRLGQCLFKLKDLEKAEDFLLSAYMMEGEEIFENDHAKYLDYMRTKYDL
jgi:tetratricopeptide (TPR) repeat protein